MAVSVLINIDVDDLTRATKFYCEALGLVVGRRLGRSVVELLGGNSTIYLLENEADSAAAGNGATRDYSRHWTPVHLDFVVPSLDPAVARAVRAGARQEGAIRTSSWGRIALFADPFGNGFCLIEFLGSGYDEVAE